MADAARRSPLKATGSSNHLPRKLISEIRRLSGEQHSERRDRALSEAHRGILRAYLEAAASTPEPMAGWSSPVRKALGFLGGQADRNRTSLAEYDHRKFGPYLGISDEGGAARTIRRAAFESPKARALGPARTPLTIGVALDAERLGSIGEVPVGPDEYAQIWTECAGRTLMSTNVGSRVNLRVYRRPPLVTIPAGTPSEVSNVAKTALKAEFKPFLETPGEPRPVVVFIRFTSNRAMQEQERMLRALQRHVATGGIAKPRLQHLGLNVQIDSGAKGLKEALRAIDLASAAGVGHVAIDGVVRREADEAISLPGLLDYLTPEHVNQVLEHALRKRVLVRPVNEVDPDTAAREIWSTLNTARAMGFNLGKYGLIPLSLEECDSVVGQIQRWFPDWAAAPVFYVDRGLLTHRRVYTGADTAEGIAVWLRMVAKHSVRVVLIDTVDKAQSWKILKTGNDPKGILTALQIARLTKLGDGLGVKILWAGGISLEQAGEFGKLGAFGIYVTTSASEAAPVNLVIFGFNGTFRGYYYPGYVPAAEPDTFTWFTLSGHTHNTGGAVTLKSASPRDTPEINFNNFEDGTDSQGEDLKALLNGVKMARKMAAGGADGAAEGEVSPGPDCETDDDLRRFIKNETWGHHASCTNKIGTASDPMAVTDSKFRVHKTKGLRIVDASVFPRIPGLFICVPIYMIAEKASDVILADAANGQV